VHTQKPFLVEILGSHRVPRQRANRAEEASYSFPCKRVFESLERSATTMRPQPRDVKPKPTQVCIHCWSVALSSWPRCDSWVMTMQAELTQDAPSPPQVVRASSLRKAASAASRARVAEKKRQTRLAGNQKYFQKNRESQNAKRRKGVSPCTDVKTANAGTDGQEELAAAKALTELAAQHPLRGP
jgi:hypothetical protein